jgi:CheY-like chemotaxis protein
MPTALIVDDEPEANKLLARLIALRGYQTRSALTAAEALDTLDTGTPDVVFLDLMLPDLPGFDVCRAIKDNPATSLVPVFVVTARIADENRDRCYALGSQGYIPKPYLPAQIFAALAEARAWRAEADTASGEIPLGGPPDRAGRQLARLRSQLVATTAIGIPALDRIIQAIQAIDRAARSWAGQAGRVAPAGLIRYVIQDNRLEISLRDDANWLDPSRLAELALDQAFDEVNITGETAPIVATLVKNTNPPDEAGVRDLP